MSEEIKTCVDPRFLVSLGFVIFCCKKSAMRGTGVLAKARRERVLKGTDFCFCLRGLRLRIVFVGVAVGGNLQEIFLRDREAIFC